MKTYLITIAVIHLLAAGSRWSAKPGTPREPNPGFGALLVAGTIHLGLALWGLNLLIEA